MKVVILAAGQGTRLRPYTNDKPKCMVELCGKPLLDYQLAAFELAGIKDITVVAGYKADYIKRDGLKKIVNARFASTNMVSTLLCAESIFDGSDDVLITYGDIIYQGEVLEKILEADGPLAITVDKEWRRLWSLRMENPLDDAETLKLDGERVIELGKKPLSYDEIQGQYMGLIKVQANVAKDFVNVWKSMDKSATYDGKDFDNMYLTSFLQYLIDSGWFVRAIPVENGWLEIDTVGDLEYFEGMIKSGKMSDMFELL